MTSRDATFTMTAGKRDALSIVVIGLSITSSWGNGHATTYRALLAALAERGHHVLFLEHDKPWYAANRDLPHPAFCTTILYGSVEELRDTHGPTVRDADLVIVGSFVPEGAAVGAWVNATARGITAFYDIDTPVTLARLERGDHDYLDPGLIPRYDLYLSFTGGPILRLLERKYGSPRAVALYCSVDPGRHFPEAIAPHWDLGYLGTYSADRQPTLDRLLIAPARRRTDARFVVGGPQYPDDIDWPKNLDRIEHLPPDRHRQFYCGQRFTLNVTREDMISAGWSPSVRLFEAAACGTPIISDWWPGLDTLFRPGREILIARSSDEVAALLTGIPEAERRMIGARARARVMAGHTALHRAIELEGHVATVRGCPRPATASSITEHRA